MNAIRPPRGGAAVGHVAELDVVEAGAVLCLRLWCDGPDAQARMRSDFAAVLGPEAGDSALVAFGELCDLCARHGRRPLLRHHVACKCIGGDEACFANFVALASEGDREKKRCSSPRSSCARISRCTCWASPRHSASR